MLEKSHAIDAVKETPSSFHPPKTALFTKMSALSVPIKLEPALSDEKFCALGSSIIGTGSGGCFPLSSYRLPQGLAFVRDNVSQWVCDQVEFSLAARLFPIEVKTDECDQGRTNVMLTKYRNCKDRGKCAYIGTAAIIACFLGVVGLWMIDDNSDRVTMVDGVYYDNNPWTKSN